jgi:hypothetical protein
VKTHHGCRFTLQRQHFRRHLLSFISPSQEIQYRQLATVPEKKKKATMAIFRNSSFLSLIFAVVAAVVITVNNPVASGQEVDDVESVVEIVVVYDDPLKCRPAVDDYSTCESTGVTWNTKSYCLDTETYDNVLGCCPADQIGAWNTTVITCRHGAIGWPQVPNSNNYVPPPSTTSTEDVDVEDVDDIGNDSTASAASSTSSSLLHSTATGIATSLVVVVIGHYY